MDTEPQADNTLPTNNATADSTPMETDQSAMNTEANSTQGHSDQNAAAENPTEGQQATSNNETLNHSQTAEHSSNALAASSTDQLDAAHDNLATLAAVSAAGAEAVPTSSSASMPHSQESTGQGSNTPSEPQTTTAAPQKNTGPSANTVATTNPSQPPAAIDEEDAKWHTVGIFPNLSTTVTSYIDNSIWSSAGLNLNSDETPDLAQFDRLNLEPGTAYRFRIRALNSVGTSDWSEISSFKTCLPGFPGAPSAIKISKSSEGAHLTWEPPPSCVSSNEIVEYSVYLAVKPGKEKETKAGQRAPAQLAFVRVYVGPANQCTVSHNSLSAAHVDCSNKPAIIFRIAARNEKGYGPATQVRWLQDPVQNSAANPNLGPNSLLSPTRVKPELGGASPSKRFKAAVGR